MSPRCSGSGGRRPGKRAVSSPWRTRLIMACAGALRRVPAHNSVLVDGNVLYFDEVNIGLAVALDEGLIVPVIRNVQDKSIFQISDEVHDLAVRARENRLSPDKVVGGTFTISVLGTVDGFTPILNAGQSSILGVGRSVPETRRKARRNRREGNAHGEPHVRPPSHRRRGSGRIPKAPAATHRATL